jgi:glycosyltransferase involved in cell wall biosynthesis
MDKALNIAHCVESYEPAKGGMPEVVKQLSERLVKAGHRVTVFTSTHPGRKSDQLNGVHIRSFPVQSNRVEGIKGDTETYFSALKNGAFDVVTFFAAQQWSVDAVIDRLQEIPGKKVFVPTGFSHFYNPAYKQYFDSMSRWMHSFDMNVFLSDNYQDINFARKHGVKNIMLIPNGAAEEEFESAHSISVRKKLGISNDQLMLLHVGTYTGIKGHREALRIFTGASIGNAVLVLAGNKIHYLEKAFRSHYSYFLLRLRALLKRKRIIFVELSRDETVSAFREADLFFFPSNVECSPIVLFESMAAGVPFLASDAGNTAEIIQWSEGGWLLPGEKAANGWARIDIGRSIETLERVVADRNRLKSTGAKGKQAWKEKFTWKKIAEQYSDLYQSLVQTK